jgi:hypothetical protein
MLVSLLERYLRPWKQALSFDPQYVLFNRGHAYTGHDLSYRDDLSYRIIR